MINYEYCKLSPRNRMFVITKNDISNHEKNFFVSYRDYGIDSH